MEFGARYLLVCLALFLSGTLSAEPLQVRVLDREGNAVSGVVVYLAPENPAAMPPPPSTGAQPEISQDEGRFSPYIEVIQTGDSVQFTNDDDFAHHIYSFNGPARFSFQLRAGEETVIDEFHRTGVVAMGCNLHDWMSGYLLVVDTPYHGRTDANGEARLDAPAGAHQLTAWHPQMREERPLARAVDLPADGVTELHLARPMAEVPQQEEPGMFDFLERF